MRRLFSVVMNVWTWIVAILAVVFIGIYPFSTKDYWWIGIVFWAIMVAVVAVPLGLRRWPNAKWWWQK